LQYWSIESGSIGYPARVLLSVVIPTLNEAEALPRTLPHTLAAARGRAVELIVSDCGSTDGTAEVARAHGAAVVTGARSRATALNAGAAASTGDALLFLHADSILPDGYAAKIAAALAKPGVVAGAFDFQFGSHPLHHGLNRYALRLVSTSNRVRFRWTRNFYGDQGLFLRRAVFDRVGGFPDVRLMEDVRLSRRLKAMGKTVVLQPAIKTSPRRFVTRGVLRQYAQDLALLGCESCGFCPESLWTRYNAWNEGAAREGLRDGRLSL